MKTTQLFLLSLLGLSTLFSHAQDVQSDALATSGGEQAGTTSGGNGANVFYGYKAGNTNSTGGSNTFIGSEAGRNNTIGNGNTYIGWNSGGYAIGSSNTYIGTGCGDGTTGNSNTFLGSLAGNNSNGVGNIIIGSQTGEEMTGSNNIIIGNYIGLSENLENKLLIHNPAYSDPATPLIWGDFVQYQLKLNGKVGIGDAFGSFPTTSGSVNVSNYNLFVKGGILTEEVRVSLNSTWADYVFTKDYKLPTLEEVEKQINEKGYLFNVPSAKEVKENGIELGEMAKIQQEKIEELTLYVIEQNKINQIQNKEIEELKELVKNLLEKK